MSEALFDRPVLVVDPGMHTALIHASADRDGCWAVTGSHDKTVRVWSLADGALLRTIRLPSGSGNVGKVYCVAMSPDGSLIAGAGWTRWTEADPQDQIYLFDGASGVLLQRIANLPSVVLHLAFSREGGRLAAVLGSRGLRVYAKQQRWVEVAHDQDYTRQTYAADFAPDGRLATASYDGNVRLYAADLIGAVRPLVRPVKAPHEKPYSIAFSPDGDRLAVTYDNSTNIDLLDGRTLAAVTRANVDGIDNGTLHTVAWSRDGQTLFAGGNSSNLGCPVFAWNVAGAGARFALPAGQSTVMGLVPLLDSDLLVAAADPWIARLGPDGALRWVHRRQTADFREQYTRLSVSEDGTCVGFGFEPLGKSPACFDVKERKLILKPDKDRRMSLPRQEGLPIAGWVNQSEPTLGGEPLPLEPYEMSRSLALHPTGDRFVLGTEWWLRAYDARAALLWRRPVPGMVWAVNITGDARLVVAAYADGTIRWHRMQDGVELLAFMPLSDRTNWVAWTPEGYYAATAGAQGMLRWHVNRGWDQSADSVRVEDIPGSYRPDVLPLVLQEGETARALGLAELAQHNQLVMLRTNSHVPPGARLHLLAIGISAYNEEFAKHLRLHYANRDAHDLASAIVATQASLYQVKPQLLLDDHANKAGILRALKIVREGMSGGEGNDLAIVFFSGHGALVEGELYLLPSEVDARDAVGIQSTALSADELKRELLALASHGRVLVLLDACHSGATTMSGAAFAMDSTALRTGLAAANITVLTSSSGGESSFEEPAWQHGAFTKVLLDSFGDPAADLDRNRLISAIGLAKYVKIRVPELTGGKQNPGMEVRFEGTLFASGI